MKLHLFCHARLANLTAGGLGVLFLAGCCPHSAPESASPSVWTAPATTTQAAADSDTVAFTHDTPGVAQPGQQVFDTPEDAAAHLKDAAAAKDRRMLVAIFGDEGKQLIFSGDRVEEENGLTKFSGHLAEYLRVDKPTPAKAILYIGHNNWPFPIPVVKGDAGWFFDTAAGKEELLNRRIGENELNAIAVCRAYCTAQKAYASKDWMGDKITQYAQHFMSHDGKKNGLYWAAGENEEISPMGPLVAEAQTEGYMKEPGAGKHQPYKGYFFHVLIAQGDAAPGGKLSYIVDGHMTKGFAMIAWPDKWGSSGIMTFIVNQDGKVHQKNLGEKTKDEVKAIAEYNPDGTWEEVKD